jgi:hypothetical protein
MEERVRLVGGTLRIDSAAGEGTRVVVRIPLQRQAGRGPVEELAGVAEERAEERGGGDGGGRGEGAGAGFCWRMTMVCCSRGPNRCCRGGMRW